MITQETIQAVAHQVNSEGPSEETINLLRVAYPELHFTYCMEDDIGEVSPAHQEQQFNLYLVDGHNHCLCFTSDAAIATGLVIAEIEDYSA